MACKKGVKKVSEKKIVDFGSCLSYLKVVSEQLKSKDTSGKFFKPSYQAEIQKTVSYLNDHMGATWSAAIKWKRKLSFFGAPEIDEKQFPWAQINKAMGEFEGWYEKHSNIFMIDHTFAKLQTDSDELEVLQ